MKELRVVIALLAWFALTQGAGLFSIGYYAYYEKNTVTPSQIAFNKLTHIALGAVSTDSTGNIVKSSYVDSMTAWQSFVNTVTPLAHGSGTKTILMLGGAGANSGCPGNFNSATSTTYYATFAQNLVNHAKSLSFDGIDLDWEECIDYAGLTRLAQKIRELWPTVFLTFPVGVLGIQNAGGDADPAKYLSVVPYLDAVNMMSYSAIDNWGGWDGPWHVSPLTGNTANHPYSISLALSTMLARGIPSSKIGIGMSFYGSCWGSPITQPVQALGSSHIKASDNTMSYRNIEANYRALMTDNYDANANCAYLNAATNQGPAGCTYVSYDNDRSIKAKADFVKAQGLQGVIIWTVAEGVLANGSNVALSSVANYFGRSYTPINWGSSTASTVTTAAATSSAATSTTGTTTGGATYSNVYLDSLHSGWTDGSWATHNLANSNPVYEGTKSISFTPTGWQAVWFYSVGFINPAIHDGVEFFINGGSAGGQNILFDITVGGNRVSGASFLVSSVLTGGIRANTWAKGYISFSKLAPGNYDGFWFQENTGGTQATLYLDAIRIKFK